MKKRARVAATIVAVLPLLALLAACVSIGSQLRQGQLDRHLIAAIKDHKTDRAISLLANGASGSATDDPAAPATVRELLGELWSRLRGGAKPRPPCMSALMLACAERCRFNNYENIVWFPAPANPTLLQALLSHGANPNTRDAEERFSALESQVRVGSTTSVKLLLDNRADPNLTVILSPLDSAAEDCRIDSARLLLQYGAKVNQRDVNGATALHLAVVERANLQVVRLFLDSGAGVNAMDNDGSSPLMNAVATDPETVELLLQHGAISALKDKDSHTALDRANLLPDTR